MLRESRPRHQTGIEDKTSEINGENDYKTETHLPASVRACRRRGELPAHQERPVQRDRARGRTHAAERNRALQAGLQQVLYQDERQRRLYNDRTKVLTIKTQKQMENQTTNENAAIENAECEVIQVQNSEMLAAINKSEIDTQIATAKQYPRNLARVLNNIETLATMDEETAASCFYVLRRQGKVIEGPSVRMAEIIASSWGNLRVQARIIGNDGKFITAQGVCHDLESNYATSVDVKRRITDKYGHTYSDDMQVVTGNAACAIAMRNAVMKVVPSALIKKVLAKAKQVSLGQSMTLENSRQNMMQYFAKVGVDEKHILDYLSVSKVDEIDIDMVVELRGLANAIKEGTTTVQETFFPKKTTPVEETKEEVDPSKDLFGGEKEGKTEKKREDKK